MTLVRGDATRIPVADTSVDAVTIAFGIRNVEQTAMACAEIRRVLKPGGRLAILEFAVPTTPGLSRLYLWYLNRVLPLIGRAVSHHNAAYGYLPASIGAFASPEAFVKILRQGRLQRHFARPPDVRERHPLHGETRLGGLGSRCSHGCTRTFTSLKLPAPQPLTDIMTLST